MWQLSDDLLFSAEPSQRGVARRLYAEVEQLPLVCPHGHVPPEWLGDPDARLGSPADLLIIPDHYVTRMLYSQGIPLEDLGVPTVDGSPVETDHRKVWKRFAENFHLFNGTPSGLWIKQELISVFGVTEKLNAESADRIYDHLEALLATEDFTPRALFRRFNIEVLCTTDAATDSLEWHRALDEGDWKGKMRPTFRPDAVVNLDTVGWRSNIDRLSEVSGIDASDYDRYIHALESRRAFFKQLGATATDHAALTAETERLSDREAKDIFAKALQGRIEPGDPARFTAHMLHEMARMSSEDGLVMQLHIGSHRNHNTGVFDRFGADRGADIPVRTEWTNALKPMLNAFGNDPDFHLIVMTLDESTYGRELAPLAGHYPAMKLGPPWWFFDSPSGMRRYLDEVIETAGVYNTTGFIDDTRAFASIPARHTVWRRVICNWLAGLVVEGVIDEDDALTMAEDMSYGLGKKAYKL